MNTQEGVKPSEFSESTDVPRTGFIAGTTFDRKQVQYAAIDGMAILAGDIVLGTVEELEATIAPAAIVGTAVKGGLAGLWGLSLTKSLPRPNHDGSIMHYPTNAFSKNGKATVVAIGGQAIGQRTGLSTGDIARVRSMYPGATDVALAATSDGNRLVLFNKGLDNRVYVTTHK